ncbi:MAG: 50S ribosomal protein L29 [Patescibacteria group bacterium]
MKIREQLAQLRRLTDKQLSDKIVENQKKLVIKRQEKLLGKVKNTAELNSLRKMTARMKTILDEKVSAQLVKDDSNG